MSNENKILLPPKNEDKIDKKTLVLDLDETLLHSYNQASSSESDYKLKLNKDSGEIYINFRPGAKDFIRKMNKFYELIIFTASKPEYANPIINLIDERQLCSHKLFRDHCSLFNKKLIKDLTKLGRDLKDIIIVDNTPSVYSLNKENGIPIPTWFEDKRDRELYNLMPILEFLSEVPDVREFIPKFVINNEVSYLASLDIMRKYKNDKKLKKKNIATITEVKPIENISKEAAYINKEREEKNELKEDIFNENNFDLLNLLGINEEGNNGNNNEETKNIMDEIILSNNIELKNEEKKIELNKEIDKNDINNIMENVGINKDKDNDKNKDNNKIEDDNEIKDDNSNKGDNEIINDNINNIKKDINNNKDTPEIINDNYNETNNNNNSKDNKDIIKEDTKINVLNNSNIFEDKNLNENDININSNIDFNNDKIFSEINDININDSMTEEASNNINNVINQNSNNNNNDIKENINLIKDINNKLNNKENKNVKDINIIQNNKESKNIEKKNNFNSNSNINAKNKTIDINKEIIKKDSEEINLKDEKKIIESKLLKKEKIRNYSNSNLYKKRNNSKSNNISLVNKNKFSALKTIDTNRISIPKNRNPSEKVNRENKSNDKIKIKKSKEKINSYRYKNSNDMKPISEMNTIYSAKAFNTINDEQIKSKSQKKLKYYKHNKSVASFSNLKKSKSKKDISIENIKSEYSLRNFKFRMCRCVSKQETFLLKKSKDKKLNNKKDKNEEHIIINLKNNNKKDTLSIDKKISRPISSHLSSIINIDSPNSKNKFLFNRKTNNGCNIGISSPKKERNIKNNLFLGTNTPKLRTNIEYNSLINSKKMQDNRYNIINKIINSPSKTKSDKKFKFNKSINDNGNIKSSPRKNTSSRKNCFVNKSKEKNSIENRLPWGWGAGYYKKNSDSIKKIKYNLEELETKTIRFNAYKKSNLISLCKSPKKTKNNYNFHNINTEENSIRKKRGLSSYATFNTFHRIKEEQKNKNENN